MGLIGGAFPPTTPMKSLVCIWAALGVAVSLVPSVTAGVAYPDPAGGWSYLYQANAGEDTFSADGGFDSLDGTWSHTNGSDEWDGSGLGGTFVAGENAPGGAQVFSEGGVSFLRIQDTGDPRDFGYGDPGSNRKIYLGHDLSPYGVPDDLLDQGVTLSFRARIPTPAKTTHPLDPLHRDGQGAGGPQPYPAGGDGYVTSDGGKGNFVIKQTSGGAFAFSLAVAEDQGQGDPNSPKAGFTGLTMNEFAGNVISGNVNFGQGTGTNVLALDPTEWHEFWIVLRKDPANIGTHEALIYVDGSIEARFFKITAGNGSDYGPGYLAMGSTATPQNSALDVDFFAVRTEAVFPPGALANLPPEIRDLTPERGTRYASASGGLRFTGVTQPPNSVESTGARLVLNGEDVSAGLVASGDIRNRTFSYSGLSANKLYLGSVIVADQTGRSSTNAVAFDTFVESQVVRMDYTDYAEDVVLSLPAGRHNLYLYAGATAVQRVRADWVSGQTTRAFGMFVVPNTGGVATGQFAPLADAEGRPIVIASTGGTITLRLTQLYGAASAPLEILAAPTTDPVPAAFAALVIPPPGATGVLPDNAVSADLVEGSATIDAGSIRVFVNGEDVTAQATQTARPDGLTVRVVPATFYASGSSVTARVTYTAGGAPFETAWSFSVADPERLPSSWATTASSVAGRPRGFTGRIHVPRQDADGVLFPNTPERAADQLANRILDPDTGEPFYNEAGGSAGDGSFVETETLNYEQDGGLAGEVGIPGDRPFPNLDALDWNYIALEVLTYLDLPRGAHRLAVACDDGFVVWAGPSAAQTTNTVGIRSPGGSTTEVTFDVLAETAGVVAFRLVYFEGSGGGDVEWYSVRPDTGQRILVNDSGGLAAYQSRVGDGSGETQVPTLAMARDGANVRVTWTGTLEAADAVGGPWSAVAGVASPASFPVSGSQKYFRSRN